MDTPLGRHAGEGEGDASGPRAVLRAVAPRRRAFDPLRRRERFGGDTSGSTAYLAAKAKGDHRLPSKRGAPEGAEGAAPRDPRATVKAGLLEPQFPRVQQHTPADGVYGAGSARRGGVQPAAVSLRSLDGWAMSPFKGTDGAPTARSDVGCVRTRDGLPGREPYGHGASVVVGGRESRPQGEGRPVATTAGARGARCTPTRSAMRRRDWRAGSSERETSGYVGDCWRASEGSGSRRR